ncbi:hypothetical protein AwEntero_27460 [Enterobacterales bacterium]|nr:hypothetical protein AwEntero_27460 [Enterobacterales bacterium]
MKAPGAFFYSDRIGKAKKGLKNNNNPAKKSGVAHEKEQIIAAICRGTRDDVDGRCWCKQSSRVGG